MLGWIANILIVVGLWQLGSKNRQGFVWNGLGEAIYVIHAWQKSMWELAAICVAFCLLAIWNWYRWGLE